MNIKNFFNKEIRANILNEDEKHEKYITRAPVEYRAPKAAFNKHYTSSQLKYLFDNGLIQEYTPIGSSWEPAGIRKGDYYEFTKRGKKLRQWYCLSFKDYLYYHVFHLYKIGIYWLTFKSQFTHYTYKEYNGSDTSEI